MGTDTTERSLANGVSDGFSKNEVFILRINPSRKKASCCGVVVEA